MALSLARGYFGFLTPTGGLAKHSTHEAQHIGTRETQSMKLALIVAALLFAACGSESKPVRQAVVGWRPLGTWSGYGNAQTDSFNIESSQWRIKWITKNEKPAGAGTFRAEVHSAVSGRPLGFTVEHAGPGHGVEIVNEDPRLFFLDIVSSNIDWSVSVEEGVAGFLPSV